jgi:tripeptide aminopeptidase
MGVAIHISEHEEYRAFRIPDRDPFLVFLSGVYRRCGIEPSVAVSGGGSDANVFNLKGITAINLSTGMQKVHSNEEFILVEDLIKGAVVVLQAITDFAEFRIT